MEDMRAVALILHTLYESRGEEKMTDKEKAIVMAFTGITMLTGDKFSVFHKYIQDIMGRPVNTHELADKLVWKQIKELSTPDFLSLCEDDESMN